MRKRILIGLSLFAILAVTLVGWRHIASEKSRLERWLGTSIPSSGSDFHVWFRQVPGTYQAELIARFQIPKSDFGQLVERLGLSQSHAMSSGWLLPTNFNTDTGVAWWHPPANQPDRFSAATNGFHLTCVWDSGLVYLRKTGAFGSPWK
jgi:hypothetical protein